MRRDVNRASYARCSALTPVVESNQFHGSSRRRRAGVLRSLLVKSRSGAATRARQSDSGVPAAGHGVARAARNAATMLPPDTDVIVLIPERMPSSFNRRSAPT
jgi:hypothetical protein